VRRRRREGAEEGGRVREGGRDGMEERGRVREGEREKVDQNKIALYTCIQHKISFPDRGME